jgi:hypothetical protein
MFTSPKKQGNIYHLAIGISIIKNNLFAKIFKKLFVGWHYKIKSTNVLPSCKLRQMAFFRIQPKLEEIPPFASF